MKLLLNSIVHSFPKKSNSCEMWFAFYLTYLYNCILEGFEGNSYMYNASLRYLSWNIFFIVANV